MVKALGFLARISWKVRMAWLCLGVLGYCGGCMGLNYFEYRSICPADVIARVPVAGTPWTIVTWAGNCSAMDNFTLFQAQKAPGLERVTIGTLSSTDDAVPVVHVVSPTRIELVFGAPQKIYWQNRTFGNVHVTAIGDSPQ
jgi:hypothetical protein